MADLSDEKDSFDESIKTVDPDEEWETNTFFKQLIKVIFFENKQVSYMLLKSRFCKKTSIFY